MCKLMKLRAWVKNPVDGTWCMRKIRWISLEENAVCTDTGMRTNEFIPCWFIGLKDKHDKEVHASDILKDKFNDLWVIRWNEHWGGFCLAKPSGKLAGGGIYYSPHDPIYSGLKEYEIIGTIYENPELLEKR